MANKRVFDPESEGSDEEIVETSKNTTETSSSNAQSAESKKVKTLPPGYVCKICGVADNHAAYACPHKIKKFGKPAKSSAEKQSTAEDSTTFEVVKGNVETTENDSRVDSEHNTSMSVFFSGLPFDLKREKFVSFLVDNGCSPITLDAKRDIKIVMFEDNPGRCKGLAFVKFHDEQQLQHCLTLHGTKFGKMSLSIERVTSSRPKANKHTHSAAVAAAAEGGKKGGAKRCFRCGLMHDPITCSNPRICYRCKSTEHISTSCPFKKQKV